MKSNFLRIGSPLPQLLVRIFSKIFTLISVLVVCGKILSSLRPSQGYLVEKNNCSCEDVSIRPIICYFIGFEAPGEDFVFHNTMNNVENDLWVDEPVDPTKEEQLGKVREVGSQAVWSLSSCKPGYGVDQLRDGCLETYWQSDGPQPHLVNIHFKKKITVQDVCIYADYKLDESYTPSRISVRVGTHYNDLQEVEVIDLTEPCGWEIVPLKDSNNAPIRTFMVQIAVLSNHQNGRDTHMRQIKIHSPVSNQAVSGVKLPNFTSIGCSKYACIR